MGDRFLLWLGAGAVCAGVTVGMLAGAGTAFAQTDSDGGDGAATTSQSAKTADNEQASSTIGTPKRPDSKPAFARDVAEAIDSVSDAVTQVVKTAGDRTRSTVTEPSVRTTIRPESGRRAATLVNDVVAAVTPKPDRKVEVAKTPRADPVETVEPVESVETVDPDATIDAVKTTPAVVPDNPTPRIAERVIQTFTPPTRSNLTLQAPALAQSMAAAAAAQPQIDVPPVISALGTAVFGLISFAESVFEGPPMALPGSGVTVERSTLRIGDQEVPADWYFPDTYDPESGTPPERIIYLQHGFLARGVFYDYTASYLAKSTNSVVVAPTLTSNIFATDGMWLGGDPMHRAIADLFNDDNTALLDSARAAGYTQNQLPQQVVLVGHSLGGGAVLNTARYMAANRQKGYSTYDLAGVVMLDGVSFTDPAEHIADPALDGIPIYNLSSTPNPWNLFGAMDAALAKERPTEFHGAQMLFGWHSDAMVGGNPLVQLGAYLITGYGGPANVEGTQVLAAGWINDLFVCQEGGQCRASGFYGAPGTSFVVPTHFGPAIGLVAPTPGLVATVGRELTAFFFGLMSDINFAIDVPATTSGFALPTAETTSASAATAAGVTGVSVGHSDLTIPYGPNGYTTKADWYFPTQADGSVQPDGVIWLQHGFLGDKSWYSAQAADLARRTNSVVVVPNVSSFPQLGCWDCTLNGAALQEATATMFLGDRSALNTSARAAGFQGALPQKYVLTGHSAGGGFATAVAGYTVDNGAATDLLGVVMFDGVSSNGTFAPALANLDTLDIPVYQIAAPRKRGTPMGEPPAIWWRCVRASSPVSC
ncbi:alpha/beta fold hydrolase [Mycobacterium sp. ITM-2016-00318]|uniref:alpha/beta fold hydrolase n=1 Tax=Mycobacterium sp. ITM-2016-00318 TaxID=2099693 RepID=UPI000CFA454B|nr:alpha/beta fold hydrolase [Mycobacterium sp. ITM-2016-00318]WNG93791.1 alpha/beta fold hydrolase [Mycobacterium sp. ITM-2016-00318]